MATTDLRVTQRHRLRFGISALLVIITISAILFAWWHDRARLQKRLDEQTRQAEAQRDAAMQAEMIARRAMRIAQQRALEAEAAVREAATTHESNDPTGKPQ